MLVLQCKTWWRKRTGEMGLLFLTGGRSLESVSKSCGVADVGMAEVRRSTALRATALGNRSTNDRPRLLRQPRTRVTQLTNLLDDFGDEVPGYHEHERPQRLRLPGKTYNYCTIQIQFFLACLFVFQLSNIHTFILKSKYVVLLVVVVG